MITRELEDPPLMTQPPDGKVVLMEAYQAHQRRQTQWWHQHKLYLRELQDEIAALNKHVTTLLAAQE